MTLLLILLAVATISATVSWIAAMGISAPSRVCSHPLIGFTDGLCRSCGTEVLSRR